jgi:hypothetical protein
MIKTKCFDCIWATWSEGTQHGCLLGRVDKFTNRNELAEYEPIDTDVEPDEVPPEEYSLVINRVCTTKRDESWLINNGGTNEMVELAGIGHYLVNEDLVDKVYKEVELDYTLIIEDDKKGEDSYDSIEYTLESTHDISIRPSKIIILLHNGATDMYRVKELSKITSIPTIITRSLQSKELALNDAVNKVKTTYYYRVESGNFVNGSTLEEINKELTFNLEKILLAYLEEGSYLVQTGLHVILDGNVGEPLFDKIEKEAKARGKEEYIWNFQ